MKILSYSKALYSSWLYYSPDRILFDAGESVSSIMGNKSFAVDKVFLSHGHTDHIAGLISLINIRNNAMGDKKKPLDIYYPRNNFHISEMMNYLFKTNSNISYPLNWLPLKPAERVQVFGKDDSRSARYVSSFRTEHSQGEISLGYNVVEMRQRLRSKYKDLSQEEIKEIVHSEGRNTVVENYQQKLFSYGGDSVPLDPAKVEETEVLCHDCTFLDETDRKQFKHATLREAIQVGKSANVRKKLICMHISSRYRQNFQEFADKAISDENPSFEVVVIPPGKIYREY